MAHAGGRPRGRARIHKEAIVLRREQAIKLRLSGKPFHAIGSELAISTSQAFQDVSAVLEESRKLAAEDAKQELDLDLSRLDVSIGAIWAKVKKGSVPAVDCLTRILTRRAKMLGYDAPESKTVQMMVTNGMEHLLQVARGIITPEEYERLLAALAGESGQQPTE